MSLFLRSPALFLALFVLVSSPLPVRAETPIRGTGATFPSRVYQAWAKAYLQSKGQAVEYIGTGSGKGLQQITERAVDFGASDVPLSDDELKRRGLIQIPTVVGAVVPVVSLPGIGSGELVLDGPTLYALMSGEISRWNDARLRSLNARLRLPDLPVQVLVRAEKSGTTYAFTRHLELSAPEMKGRMQAGELPLWPGQPTAVDGNDGMVKALRSTPGAIGYVSFDRVIQDQLSSVALLKPEGTVVTASEDSLRAAVRASEAFRQGNERASLLGLPGGAWPITVATFWLVDAQPRDAAAAQRVLRFIYWVFLRGDRMVADTGFIPLPTVMQARLASRLEAVRSADGARVPYTTE